MALKDKIQGIFSGDDQPSERNPNSENEQKIVNMVFQDFSVFRAAREGMEDIWRKEQRFYNGDHWHGLRPKSAERYRPNSVDNLAWSKIESIVSKLSGWMPYPDFEAQEERDEPKAKLLNEYIPYELQKINFKQKYTRAVRRMVIHGPLIFKIIFDPTVEGGRGNHRWVGRNDIIPVDLGSFFPDPRIRDFIDLQSMKAIIVKTVHPIEYFRERWPERGKHVSADENAEDVEIFDIDGKNVFQFNTSSDGQAYTNQETAGLIEYWYRGLPKMISKEDRQMFRELAQEKLAKGRDPSEALAKAEGRMEGVHCIYVSSDGVFLEHKAYVYDHGQYPFVARTLFPVEGNIWGKGFMRDLIKPQIMLNKFAEIAVETAAKSGNSAIMYEEGAIRKPQIWKENRSLEGAMLPVAQGRLNDVKELRGVNVPSTVFHMMNYYQDMIQKISGQYDTSEGQAAPSVTSGEQAKALISAASVRLNTASEVIQDALEHVFMQYIELMAQFYTIERTARITGNTTSISRDSLINMVPAVYEMDEIDSETGEPIRVQVLEEFVPEMDIRVNIAVDKPVDREYWIQMAFNLLGVQDPITGAPMVDAEAIRYTIQNGRMEPMNVIEERIQEKMGLAQQIQQLGSQLERLQQENQSLQQQLNQLLEERNAQEYEQKMIENELKSRKLDIEETKVASQIAKQMIGM